MKKSFKKIKSCPENPTDHFFSFYNRQNRRKSLEKKLESESRMVQQSSREVLEEFEQLEDCEETRRFCQRQRNRDDF